MRTVSRCPVILGLLVAILLAAGCGDEAPPAGASDTVPAGDGPRLVTLAPALSQMLVDLGLGETIVGVAEFDVSAPPGRTIVGNYTAVNTESLVSTRPTHVLMMAGPAGAPARLQQLADSGLFELHTFPFPLSIQDIGQVLYDEGTDPAPSLGAALGVASEAAALKLRLLHRLSAIRMKTADRDPPSVLMVIGTAPVMASGPGTVHDELLGFAGGLNAAADAAVTAPEYDRESLLALAPEVILFLQPDAPDLTDDDPRLAAFDGLPIPAVGSGRIYVLNDPLVLLPSTSIDRICAQMAEALHPEVAEEIDGLSEHGDHVEP